MLSRPCVVLNLARYAFGNISAANCGRGMTTMRSLLFTQPKESGLQKALSANPDAIVFDFEDAVPMPMKPDQRVAVTKALRTMRDFCNAGVVLPPVYIRVNSLEYSSCLADDTEFLREAQAASASGEAVAISGIMLPKVSSSKDVLEFASRTRRFGAVSLIPIIETAAGVIRAHEIASSSSDIVALILGHMDLLNDLGATQSMEAIAFARNNVLFAARAANLQPLDTAYLFIKDIVGFEVECKKVREMGFAGKAVLHPSHVRVANKVFSPSQPELTWASQLLQVTPSMSPDDTKRGVWVMNGSVIGPPLISRALSIMRQAKTDSLPLPQSTAAVPVKPVLFSGGMRPHDLQQHARLVSPLRITISAGMVQTWLCSFFEMSPLQTSEHLASMIGLPSCPVPYTLIMTLTLAMSVIRYSENALLHLSVEDVQMHQPVFAGDTLRNEVVILSARNTTKDSACIVRSLHVSFNQHDDLVCSAIKVTMFPASLQLGSPAESSSAEAISALRLLPPMAGSTWWHKAASAAELGSYHPLSSGSIILHRVIKIFGSDEHRALVNLLRVTNQHHVNPLQFRPSELLVAGPLSVSAFFSSALIDLGPSLQHRVHYAYNFNKVNIGDVLGALTYILSVTPVPGGDLEEVATITLGVKNVDVEMLGAAATSVKPLCNDPAYLPRPSELETFCELHAPELLHKVVMRASHTIIRQRPQ
jgi:citrate lyase subunit beta/citryl-CoA lyase